MRLLLILLLLTGCGSKASTSSGGSMGGSPKMDEAFMLAGSFADVSPLSYQVITSGNSGVSRDGVIYIYQSYIDSASMVWLACGIIHELWHYRNGAIGGIENEIHAISYQIQCLQALGATDNEIRYAQSLDGSHFDSNGNGLLDHGDKWNY